MDERIAIVTGANVGLGFETTRALANAGYHVVMACRNQAKAERARESLLVENESRQLTLMPLDVSEPESIAQFAQQYSATFASLNLLVNNAGIIGVPLTRNSVGHELLLATNYLGVFALTARLLPCFDHAVGGRIVNVGSLIHRFGRMPIKDLNFDRTPHNVWKAYTQSKLALMSHTLELGRRLSEVGSAVIVASAHPGFADTDIGRKDGMETEKKGFIRSRIANYMSSRTPTAEASAQPIVLAALSDTVCSGDYYGPSGFLEIAGPPAKAKINRSAHHRPSAQALWRESEQLCGIDFVIDSRR